MNNLIEFPKNRVEENEPSQSNPSQHNYAGHILMLDLTKARKWQCFNFLVGVRCRAAIVPETSSMDLIHDAVEAGILIDVTEHPELFTPDKAIAEVIEHDTGKKLYSGTRSFFRGLGIDDPDHTAPEDETVSYATEDAEEQNKIQAALDAAPVVMAQPLSFLQARQRGQRAKILLAPGMDVPERYLLPLPRAELL